MSHTTPPGRAPARLRLALINLCLLTLGTAAGRAMARDCVIERDSITVSGEMHRKRFRTPDATGRDSIVILRLQSPLCVMLPDDVNLQLRPQRIKELQLDPDDKLPRGPDQLRQVAGTVLLAQAAHHHLPVVLTVSEISQLPAGARKARR
jgi:hypothetical protein